HNAFMQSGVRSSFECKSFVSKEGLIHSLEMNIKIDIGSCNPFAEDIIDRLVIASCNIYSIPNILINAIALRSEKSPSSINPELVDSPAFFAIENHIMQIAERLSLLPIEVQKKNISTSKTPTMTFNFKLQHVAETIENTLKVSDFNRKKASFELDAKTHISRDSTFFALPIRGIACACAFDGSGFLHDTSFLKSKKISLVIESETSALIYADMPSETVAGVWKKMLSQATNISENNIQIIPEPASSDTSPSFYSNIGIMTELLHQCCKDLNKKMEKPTFPISIKKGISASAKKMWNRENFSGYPFYASSFASTALELELASHTYNVNIKGIWITIDCGKILVTKAAENAVRIAIQQELNHLIAGQSVHCEQVHIAFIKSDRAPVQIGSLIHSTLPAAFSNAMSQALGIKIHSIPCNTEMLYTLGDKTVGGKA
ncbi:MAG: molybdopterin-dependent oxidoreductase, partial [Treponema sp.]|nr:molybdopterin-dependent oxidoreductase [Treponema sp.]